MSDNGKIDIMDYVLPDFSPEPPEEPKPRKATRREVPATTVEVEMPSSIDAEKTILGAILLDDSTLLEVSEKLVPEDFFLDSHRRILQRMIDLMNAKRAIDIVTLTQELSQNKEMEAVGGWAYIASLTEGLPRRPVIDEYIRIVKDKAMLRGLMGLSSETIARAGDQSEPALEIAGWQAARLEEVVSGGIHRGLQRVDTLTIEVLNRFNEQSVLDGSPGLSFGVPGLDEATGGIQDGEQVVIGCFSGVGKTTLLAQIVAANCPQGHPAAMFLIEPTRHDFLRRLWSIVGDVRYTAVTKPWMATKEERDRIRWAAEQVLEWGNLFIYDKSNLTLDEQQAHARLAIHRHGVELIGLDYIQRLKVKSADKGDDMRLKIGRASTANADLVKNSKCRNVILSQLNRSGGMGVLPSMDKLRESGQLENDAATILLLHLKYDEEQGHFTDEGAGIIPKQRFGIPCNVALYKDPRTALWCSGTKPPAVSSYVSAGRNYHDRD